MLPKREGGKEGGREEGEGGREEGKGGREEREKRERGENLIKHPGQIYTDTERIAL